MHVKSSIPFGSDVRTCPVRALQAWLELSDDGPLFRSIAKGGHIGGRLSDHSVALIVKKLATNVEGLDADKVAGHSLRSGFDDCRSRW